jgi:hypothetical protein
MRRKLSAACYVVAAGLLGSAMAFVRDVQEVPAATLPASPLMAVLDRFVSPNVPALGPDEPGPTPRTWPEPASTPELPGRGLAQHPMLLFLDEPGIPERPGALQR